MKVSLELCQFSNYVWTECHVFIRLFEWNPFVIRNIKMEG